MSNRPETCEDCYLWWDGEPLQDDDWLITCSAFPSQHYMNSNDKCDYFTFDDTWEEG